MAAFERIADITPTVFTDDLRPQWGPIQVPPGANPFSVRIVVTMFVTSLRFQKALFLKFFWKLKETKLVFNARKSLIGVGALPIGERAQELCIAMSDGH